MIVRDRCELQCVYEVHFYILFVIVVVGGGSCFPSKTFLCKEFRIACSPTKEAVRRLFKMPARGVFKHRQLSPVFMSREPHEAGPDRVLCLLP